MMKIMLISFFELIPQGQIVNQAYLAPNDLLLIPKIKSALKGREDLRILKTLKKGGESTTRFPKIFPTVATSLGLMHSCSSGVLRR
jgi:hypothetical protein